MKWDVSGVSSLSALPGNTDSWHPNLSSTKMFSAGLAGGAQSVRKVLETVTDSDEPAVTVSMTLYGVKLTKACCA